MDSTKLDELEKAAKAATPGPWRSPWLPGSRQQCAGVEKAGSHYIVLHCEKGYHKDTVEMWKRDCTYIAAASPDTILEMVRELRVQKRALEIAVAEQWGYGTLSAAEWIAAHRHAAERELGEK